MAESILTQVQYEKETWKRLVSFMTEENIFLKKPAFRSTKRFIQLQSAGTIGMLSIQVYRCGQPDGFIPS
jgi:hypothetical protein